MKKLTLLVILASCCSYFSKAQESSPRKRINFDKDWKFHLGHAADATKDFNYSIAVIYSKTSKSERTAIDPRFKDSSWRTLQLPHDWAVELPFENSTNFDVMAHGYKPVGGLYPQNSIGWYRKHFTISRSDSGQRFVIQFDGIFRDSKIWLNGFYVGNNASGYSGASFDVTDYINFERDNVLVVRVDASQYEGWFYEGAGIYRHVWLNEYNNLHFVDNSVFVYTTMQGKSAVVNIEATVKNQGQSPASYGQSFQLLRRDGKAFDGKPFASTSFDETPIGPNETRTLKFQMKLDDPTLWSPDSPYLYRAVVEIRHNNNSIDKQTVRFGVRTIEVNNKGLFVNGKYVKVLGVCCHQDHGGLGSALPDYLQYYRIGLLKEMGVNAYRTSHNPPTPELLDACDSLGMLVLDENRLLNSSPEYMSQFERLILRDRNHPSVFMWSLANEEGYVQTTSYGKRIAQTLLAKQKELDPTRISTYAADVANIYRGINEVIPVRGFNYRIAGVDPYHQDHPDQPIIGTEMGSTVTTRGIYKLDSVIGYVPDQDITAPWWANKAEDWWSLAADRPWWMGGFVWTGFDYRGEPTPFQWPNINSHFGIMDMCGFPKNIYYYYQSWWTDKDVLHISPHWNWKGKEGQPIDVWVNTNADNVELFLNGKSQGKKDMPRNRHLLWSVPYKPGTLEAVAYKKGKKISAKVETTDEAYALVLTASKPDQQANGQDATVINVIVKDKKGREVPDAGNLVQFEVAGNASIIGVANGDPSSHDPDKIPDGHWQRHMFNGKCQVIVQAGTTPGNITITAKSDGLQQAAVVVNQK